MAGIRDEEEMRRREEERLERNVDRRHGLDKAGNEGGLTNTPNTDLHFVLKGLPAEAAAPVQILVNDDPVYSSEGFNGDLTASFAAPIRKGYGNSVNITLKIPVMGLDNTRKFSLADGFYFKFEATDRGLSILHQTKPFN